MNFNRNTCKVPVTHNRLLEAHYLWHQAALCYHDPFRFRTHMNALIQALRNITFALQNEKRQIPGFEIWYKNWTDRIKRDEVLSWLNEARVKVVHKTDLETQSKAIATIQTYIDLAKVEMDIPPFLSPDAIVSHIMETLPTDIPCSVLDSAIVTIERQWVDKNLEGYELLDALAHAFEILRELVLDAHHISDCVNCGIDDPMHQIDLLQIKGKLPCMVDFNESRFKTFSISDGQQIKAGMRRFTPNKGNVRKASRRYRLKGRVPANIVSNDVVAFAESVVEYSKELLARDKHHTSIVFLRKPEGGWQMYNLMPKNRSEKFLLWRRLAEEAEMTNADALVDVHEVWMGRKELLVDEGLEPGEQPDRKEALQVTLFSSSGHNRVYVTPFSRGFAGRIIFGKTMVSEGDKPYYLLPILRKWGLDRLDLRTE